MDPVRFTAVLLASSLMLAGGARGQSPGTGAGGIVSRFIPRDILIRMQERPDDLDAAITIPGPLEGTWTALAATLEELGVPVAFADQQAGEIGTPQAKLFRRMGKERLSTYLRCGSGLTGPNADSYAVYLSLVVFVRPLAEGEVALQPFLAAQAVDVAGGRNDPIQCTTTGKLERRIGNGVKLKVLKLGS